MSTARVYRRSNPRRWTLCWDFDPGCVVTTAMSQPALAAARCARPEICHRTGVVIGVRGEAALRAHVIERPAVRALHEDAVQLPLADALCQCSGAAAAQKPVWTV